MSLKQLIRSLVGCADYDDLKQKNIELYELAHYDSLTKLANRLMFDKSSTAMIEMCKKDEIPLAIFLIDLDNFKFINDTHGHLVGNEVLREVASRLNSISRARTILAVRTNRVVKSCTQPSCEICAVKFCGKSIVSRLSGDEFAMMFVNMDKHEAAVIAQQIQQVLKEPITINNTHDLNVSASVGISLYPFDGNDLYLLLKMADMAMYASKENGKDRYKFYRPSMSMKSERRAESEFVVRDIINSEEVGLFYQPIVCTKTGKVIGAEALLRGKKSLDKFFDPAELIEIAEDANLIIPFGALILETACKFARTWIDKVGDSYDPFISVNVSVTQLLEPDFVDLVNQTLERTGLKPSNLVIEITENMLMHEYSSSASVFRDLNRLGVRISIDDFGKGYSSFSYLQNLPVDKIKIDISFIRGIGNDNKAGEIVKGIILLAETLGMSTCAEGVETELQFKKLKQFGCNQIQGYFKYRPLNEEEFVKAVINTNP